MGFVEFHALLIETGTRFSYDGLCEAWTAYCYHMRRFA